jgi:hypothetical protein
LRERLVASDCVPPDDDPVDLPECKAVWRVAAALMRCGHLPVEHKQATGEGMSTLRRSLRSLAGKEGGDDLAIAQCQETEAILRVNAEALHCQL